MRCGHTAKDFLGELTIHKPLRSLRLNIGTGVIGTGSAEVQKGQTTDAKYTKRKKLKRIVSTEYIQLSINRNQSSKQSRNMRTVVRSLTVAIATKSKQDDETDANSRKKTQSL